eukprot:gene19872-52697_t
MPGPSPGAAPSLATWLAARRATCRDERHTLLLAYEEQVDLRAGDADDIKTPIIHGYLVMEDDEKVARVIKARVERTRLSHASPCIVVRLDVSAIERLEDTIHVLPYDAASKDKLLHTIHHIKTCIPDIVIAGIDSVKRAVIKKYRRDKNAPERYMLLIEGEDLLSVLAIPGIDARRTTCNHIYTIEHTLGIEAARAMIIKMWDSVLMLASFEKTTDVLFDAAVHRRTDAQMGVSQQIIFGAPIKAGTG